jgi:hypothetical protein
MTEHSLKPPSVNVLFNPSADDFPHGGVKKSLHRAEGFECSMLKASPVRHLRVILFDRWHIGLPAAKFGPAIPLRLVPDRRSI